MKKRIFILALVLLFVLMAACTQGPVKGEASSINDLGNVKNVRITADNCNVKEGVSPQSNTLATADKNTTYDVLSKVQDYYCVKLPDNRIGFVPENQCTPIVSDGKGTNLGAGNNVPAPGNLTGNLPGDADNAPGNIPDNAQPDLPNNMTGDNGEYPWINPNVPGATPSTGTPGTTPNDDVGAPNYDEPDTTARNKTVNGNLTDKEQEMLDLVNAERAKNNVPALQADVEVTDVARIKSQDMIDNNYFSHNSPTYGSPFDMMNDFGIEYVKAGENIAGNQSVQNAHDSLMNSPGHRKNILDPDYTHIGIGIKEGSQYGNIFTQMFISKPQ